MQIKTKQKEQEEKERWRNHQGLISIHKALLENQKKNHNVTIKNNKKIIKSKADKVTLCLLAGSLADWDLCLVVVVNNNNIEQGISKFILAGTSHHIYIILLIKFHLYFLSFFFIKTNKASFLYVVYI